MPLAPSSQTYAAAVLAAPGELQLHSRRRPVPQTGEVLVKMHTVGICGSDTAYFLGTAAYPINEPFVMGHEASGVVAATGEGVVCVLPGARVALIPSLSCGSCEQCRAGLDNLCPNTRYLGSAAVDPHRDGALQEYLVVPATHVLPLPENIDHAVGALLEPMAVALHAARKTPVAGRSVLIVGGGAIGQLTAVAVRGLGCKSLTVMDVSARRAHAAVEHGADFSATGHELAAALDKGRRFDVVFDASGHPAGVEIALRAVQPGTGHVVLVGNLPAGSGIPHKYISQAESWVTSTLRFAGGLAPALEFLTENNLDISWLVEQNVQFTNILDVFEQSPEGELPLKTHIRFSD
ncbi:L-idonate 5-dehydrogenase [Arthrobacter silviterrae]|uniref:zinc-dependent alcohol dehydrogenase n=1 Tax=Arthrobacter silviterrae TaxID=2026658 RepID=UPI0023F2BFD5|nr:alcohol dehydrogenase catalytic domain-containing protein [Arthrobacter silviterrae]MDQ0278294.1 L-idonate 5-dehydrogenase [Arthrobacter silviterrae]